jgi:glycosyltransferase involved in cell wall biosynthesis
MGPDLEMFEAGVGGALRRTHRFASYRAGNRVLWGILRRSPIGFPQAQLPLLAWSWAADRMISRWIRPCDVFHGLTGVCLAAARSAKQLGAAILIDKATLHPSVWQREVLADCASAGVRPESCERLLPKMLIRREEREYELCDRIIVYSRAAWQSFQPFPYGDKAVIVRPGIDHRLFAPSRATRRDPTFRACYVGRIEAAKGVHYLTRAWQRLMLPGAELVLAGDMPPNMAWLHEKGPPAGIRLAGILGQKELAALYREADVFVFPSVNEGLPLALLEAMSAGLPAIACCGTGAEDLLTPGSTGRLVPGRDVDALASALMWCYENRQQLPTMGEAARARIEEEFTLAHYAERLLGLYQLAADTRPSEWRQ